MNLEKQALTTVLMAAALGGALNRGERRVRKPKPRKCRTAEQIKRRNKNRIANKSRAINFKRAK